MKPIAKLTATISVGAMLMVLAACDTTKGAGKDIENAGKGIQKAADKAGAS